MKPIVIALTGLILASCSQAAQTAIGEGVERIRDAEDNKARLALQAPCAITIGAKNRVLSDVERRAVESLCGGQTERPVTVEDLQRFLEGR